MQKFWGCGKSSTKREVYSIIGLTQEQGKSQINNLTLHFKEKKKRHKISRRKKIT